MSRRSRRGRTDIHGMVLVNKASGPTSFRVMRAVQRQLEVGKAGHGGTLDPMASGLLIVLLGEATKLTPWIHGRDKSYRALIRFGTATDTLDAEGAVVERKEVPNALLEAELGAATLVTFDYFTSENPRVGSSGDFHRHSFSFIFSP